MTEDHVSARAKAAIAALAATTSFFTESAWARGGGEPGACDFAIGNPQEMPLPAFTDALQRWAVPRDSHWYAYKMNEPSSRDIVAGQLRKWRGVPFEPEDVFLTNGATAGLSVALGAIIEPGDEVIFITPPWFQYEAMILFAGGAPVRVRMDATTFDLDLEAIAAALNGKTRAIIINSPHNPSGKIYPPSTLTALARLLNEAGERYGRRIYLISDEAYSRIIFDGRTYHSPTSFYPHSMLVYTFTKVLLSPGQRIGFIALPPEMPDREKLRAVLPGVQMLSGWAFPNALLQHALGDIAEISIDIGHLQSKRDRLVGALRDMGYRVHLPEGTFYVISHSPIADDKIFVALLEERNVFCIPGSIMDLPGFFRLSLTASDDMIERALPVFATTLKQVGGYRER
jgi:aspartate aminotransferase